MVGKEKKLCWNPLLSWQWRDSTNVVSAEAETARVNEKEHASIQRESTVSISKFEEEIIAWILIQKY